MKILQVIQKPQLRGAEIFACQLSRELIRMGETVDVVYLYPTTNFELEFDLNFIPLHGKPARRLWDFRAYRKLAAIVKTGNYDIVQANASDTLKYAVFSKKLFKWKTPIVFRNANKLGAFIRNPLQRAFNRWLLNGCDYFISVSENCRLDLVDVLASARDRSETITIGTYDFFESKTGNTSTGGDPIIVNVGSLAPEKNHAFLLEVFHHYYTRHKKGQLWLVGDGRLRPQLARQVEELSLGNRVKFWGYRKDAIDLVRKADVMVMPSRIEGLPGVILEALSVGTPVVASSAGGIPEVIQDGFNGFCIVSWDPKLYVERIEQIVQNSALAQTFVNNGRATIVSKFQMPVIARQFQLAYDKLIKTPSVYDQK